MATSTAGSRAGNTSVTPCAAPPRLFDRLDAASQERVTLLLSRVQALLPVELDAFMQELLRQQEEAQQSLSAASAARGKLVRYTGQRLQAVQARDRGYVVPRALPLSSGAEGKHGSPGLAGGRQVTTARAAPPCTLEDLVGTRGMFGEADVVTHLEKMSLYDRLHQNIAELSDPAAVAAAVKAGEEGSTSQPDPLAEISAQGGETQATPQLHGFNTSVEGSAPRNTYRGSTGVTPPFRSNAYQAVRLAMSTPGFIAARPPASPAEVQTGYDGVRSVLNTTGMPVSESDLQEWFDELDEEGRGALSLDEFQRYMESLERDFGVSDEYAALQRAGERLAFDGRLTFEAFAYLVLRFARV